MKHGSQLEQSKFRGSASGHLSGLLSGGKTASIEDARRRFFERGEQSADIVGRPVLDSWLRSMTTGRKPTEMLEHEPVSKSKLSAAKQKYYALLESARSEVELLEQKLAGSGLMVSLISPENLVLYARQPDKHTHPALHTSSRPGVVISEDEFGICGTSLALTTREMVFVEGGHHYFDCQHTIRTMSAPILGRGGKIAGVLSIYSEAPWEFNPHWITRHAATVIENNLLIQHSPNCLTVSLHPERTLLGTTMEVHLGVDERGYTSWINSSGRDCLLLNTSHDPVGHPVAEFLGLEMNELLSMAGSESPSLVELTNGLLVWLRVNHGVGYEGSGRASASTSKVCDIPGSIDTISQATQKVASEALARNGGNVAKAARELKVSRGWLYRHLKTSH